MAITSDQYRTSLQNIQSRYIQLELLNYQFQTVDTLEGVAISGSISIDANADIRRTGSIVMTVSNGTFEVGTGNKIWLDKYIRVYVGTANSRMEAIDARISFSNMVATYANLIALNPSRVKVGQYFKVLNDMNYGGNTTYYRCSGVVDNVATWTYIGQLIEWTNCGIYIIDAPSYSYDLSTNTLTLSLLDLMAKLTGIRNGYLPGVPALLSAGENIRQTIINTLALGGFTKYVVEEAPSPGTIPNDLEFSRGATVYDLLAGLRDIYPDFEIFFDVEGTFYYKPIPTGEGDAIIADDELWSKIVLTEQLDTDFQSVKNSIEVYGRTHDPAHFSTATSVSGVNISLTIAGVSAYTADMIYGFALTDNTGITAPYLKINSLANYPILNDDGTSANIVAESGEVYYCVQFQTINNVSSWRWLGHLQAYGSAKDDANTASPFFIGDIGEIRLPLYGGEYENCLTDELAQVRAEYELWMHCNMNNTLTLSCVVCPWLDVNQLIERTLARNGVTSNYLIKTISYGLEPSSTMSINAIQFYPNYPNITGN